MLIINDLNANGSGFRGMEPGLGATFAAAACSPQLFESTQFSSELSWELTIPYDSSAVRVSFQAPEFDTTSQGRMRDAFEIEITDLDGNPVTFPHAPLRPAVFNWSEQIEPLRGPGVQTLIAPSGMDSTATINLPSLPVGSQIRVTARLLNNDADVTSKVIVRGFEVIESPESLIGIRPHQAAARPDAAVDFATLTDVTGSVVLDYGSTSYDELRQHLFAEVSLVKQGTFSLAAPLVLAIAGISDPDVRPIGYDGRTPDGLPYYDFTHLVDSADFDAGDPTMRRTISFLNPHKTQFTFQPLVLAQVNRDPYFTSQPKAEAIVGRAYRYDVVATDPDGDALQFNLVSGPADMSIDAATGALAWMPTAEDLGNHEVILRVRDGRGGQAQQAFTLSAIDPPPNRPPVVLSSPKVAASVGETYAYAVIAEDADGDVLTYSVIEGPIGLSIDATSGQIVWQPAGEQLGEQAVRIQVSDRQGGEATQAYVISVVQTPGNNAPVFVSTPSTTFNLPGTTRPATGMVNPTAITADLPSGNDSQSSVSITFPNEKVEAFADIVFIVDETGNMEFDPSEVGGIDSSRQGWIRPTVEMLDDQLNAAGIGPNRFALSGFGHYRSSSMPVQVREHANVDTLQLANRSFQSSLRSADLNGDGHLDLIGSQTDHYILLNEGDGSFAQEVVYPTGDGGFKMGVEIVDMNNDGILDLVSRGSDNVQVFIGKGDGSFEAVRNTQSPVPLHNLARLAVGDINSDGFPDVISQRWRSVGGWPELYVFLNDGSGSLMSPTVLRFEGLSELSQPSLADINGNGNLDLIVYTRQGIGSGSIFAVRSALGDGAGGFAEPQIIEEVTQERFHLIDLNNDNFPDLVWEKATGVIGVAMNDGLGGFGQVSSFEIGGSGSFQAQLEKGFADLDGDGALDLVIRTGRGVSVLFGDGNGGFPRGEQYQTHASPTYNLASTSGNNLTIGDFDGDGFQDIVLADNYDSELKILRGIGDGKFDGPIYRYVSPPAVAGEVADMNGDGHLDWVAISSATTTESPRLSVFFGDGLGGIASRVDYPIGEANSIAVGDVDNDGHVDVVINQNATDVAFYKNAGDGSLELMQTQSTTSSFAVRSLTIADVNADGFNDLIASASVGSSIFYGSDSGLFSESAVPITSTTGNDFRRQAVADFNGNGFLDIASPTNSTNGWNILLSTPLGDYAESPTFYSDGNSVRHIAAGDVDGDGDLDLYTYEYGDRSVSLTVWLNNGLGEFTRASSRSIPAFSHGSALVATDLNGDGFTDVVVAGRKQSGFPVWSDVAVLFSRGDGTLDDPILYEAHGGLASWTSTDLLSVADFNGDGSPDLLTGSGYYGSVSVLLNDGYGDLGRFGTADQMGRSLLSLNSDGSGPGAYGIYPDPYLPIESALDYVPRPGAITYYVLVAATDRIGTPSSLSFAEIRDELQNRGVVFDVVVDAEFTADSQTALAVNGLGQAIVSDGIGGYEVLDGGDFVSGIGRPDYIDLSWSLGGTAWDLELLRNNAGGVARQAFIDRSIQQIEQKQGSPITVIASDPDVLFENLSGATAGVGPGQTASFDIQLTGDGLAQAFDLLFVQEATSTIVGSIPVTINALYTYEASAIDSDGDPLIYRFVEAPEDANIDAATGLVTWRPTVAGNYPFQIEAVDPFGGRDVQEFVVTVTSGRGNTDPVVDSPIALPATAGQAYSLQISASDPEDDQLSYFLIEAPEGLAIGTTTGRLAWVANESQVGQQQVTVQVRDGRGGIAETSFIISVLGTPFNHSPRIQSDPPLTAPVGEPLIYQASATDEDGHPIRWDLAVGPEGGVIDPESGLFVWTPKQYESRPIDLVIRASDDYGGVDLQRFRIALDRPNTAPLILPTPDSRLVVGLPHEYQVLAQDGENESLTYQLEAPGIGASIDSATGLIQWTPSNDELGTHDLTVSVNDEQGNISTSSFVFEVVEDAANSPPAFVRVPSVINPRITLDYAYQLEAVDPNGDPLFFELLAGPTAMSVSPAGLLSWRPAADGTDEYAVRARVSDGRGGSSTVEFLAYAVPIEQNSRPVALNDPPVSAVVARVYAHDFVGFDLEGDPILWDLRSGPVGMSIDAQRGTLRWVPQKDQIGQHAVSVLVLDGQFQFGFDVVSFVIDVRAGNSPPLITSTPPTLAAVDVPLTYQISARDIDGDSLTYESNTTLGSIDSQTGVFTWTPSEGNVGGTSRISVAVSDGVATTSQTFDVVVEDVPRNRLPVFESTPSFLATINKLYQYEAVATDPDGGSVTYELITSPSGMTIDATTGLVEWTPNSLGQFSVAVRVEDSARGWVTQHYSVDVLETNSPPVIMSTPVEAVAAGGTYRYDVIAVDDDPEPLAFSLSGQPDGMTIDTATGQIRWMPALGDAGVYPFQIAVTDPRGASAMQSVELSVGADLQAPQIAILLDRNPVPVGETSTIRVTAVDDVKVTSLRLTVDGQVIPLDQNGTARITTKSPGQIQVTVTASDPSGNQSDLTETLLVSDPNDSDAPLVIIDSPDYGQTITGYIDVVGTVTDPTLASYELAVAPLAGGPFTVIATGNTPITNGLLGQFDPSALLNGEYIIQLRAIDTGGNQAVEQIVVSVAGDLKIGNFTLSFTDLTVPVSGIPITLSRTYDSLTTQSNDDLGYGWRLELKDTDLRTSVTKTGAEEDLIYNPFFDGARVFVTLPGGRREGFTFRITPAPGVANRILGIQEGSFVPDAGVYNSLSAQKFQLRVTQEGEALDYATGLPFNPASQLFGGTFTLTTPEGIQYIIDGDSGDLRSVADRNGNTLSFSDQGISSSAGTGITFERDARGRITAVVDPLGQKVRYEYDALGDLVAVTDREGHRTQFIYAEPSRPHFLTEIRDPLGRSGIRSEYDDLGRLIKMIDADGQAVELVHDPDTFTQTVRDQLGNPTTYQYDRLGNIITEIDAHGGVTHRTYDDSNNPTLETTHTVVLADGTELTTAFSYDSRGNKLIEADPLSNITQFTYDGFGNVLTTTDPLGNTSTNAYDSSGNLLSTTDPSGRTTSFTYDPAGNPLQLAVGDSGTTFQYDSAGNVTRQKDAEGTVRTFTYDANGNQLTETLVIATSSGPSTVVISNEYDAVGRITRTSTAQDGVILSSSGTRYDAVGNRIEQIDALGRLTKFIYDDRGLLTESILPDDTPGDDTDNLRTRTEYDAAGRVTAEVDELGRKTKYVYDAVGRRTETILPDETPADDADNPRTRTEYDLSGRVTAEIDPRGNRTRFEYDAAGNQTVTILPDETPDDDTDNPRIISAYNVAGQRTSTTDPLGRTTTFVYSAGGLLTETRLADGTSTTSGFDSQSRLTSRTDQNGNTTEYEYDTLGRMTAVVHTVETRKLRTEYEYDQMGNLTVQRDALGRETRYEYDGLGRRTKTILPDGTPQDLSDNLTNATAYDAVGNVTSTTDFNGDTVAYEYDTLDRLVKKDFPTGPDVTFTYTATGQRETVTDGRGTTSYEYDAQDRLTKRIDPDGAAIGYSYDAAGNRTTVTTTLPTNDPRTTHYTFDAQNRLETVTDPESGLTTYFYDAAGQLLRTELPNNTYETREYDQLGRLLAVESFGPGDVILAGFEYALDAAGNRTRITEESSDGYRVVHYAYDELYRLISEAMYEDVVDPALLAAETVDRTITYAYDDVGNRLERSDSAEGVTAYDYDEMDRLLDETLTELAGDVVNQTYGYDNNGNTLSKITERNDSITDEVFYDWNFENYLTAADTDGDGTTDVVYEYDADGIRVSKSVNPEGAAEETRFLIDANRPYAQVLEEYTPGGIIKVSYVHGHDLVSQNRHGDSGKSFYHVDGLGSTKALSGTSGSLTDLYRYDAYGRIVEQSGSTPNLYLYAGEQRDPALGLDYLRARFLDTSHGSFISRDEFEGALPFPNSLHKYGYGFSSPANYVDPTGRTSLASVGVQVAVYSTLSMITRNAARQFGGYLSGQDPIIWTGTVTAGELTGGLGGGIGFAALSTKLPSGQTISAEYSIVIFSVGVNVPLSIATTSQAEIHLPSILAHGMSPDQIPDLLSGYFGTVGAGITIASGRGRGEGINEGPGTLITMGYALGRLGDASGIEIGASLMSGWAWRLSW
jgi:RHS repeat-associated protein